MNCYVHPDVAAVGVCSYCGQGICSACAVKIGGKLYCKTDVESGRSQGASTGTGERKGPSLTAATYFYASFGLVSIFVAVVLILAGSELGQQSSLNGIPYAENFVGTTSVAAILLGVVFIFQAALDILAVFWLGGSCLFGGKLGMVLAVLWTVIFAGICIIPGGWGVGLAGIILNLTVIFLLISAWKELD